MLAFRSSTAAQIGSRGGVAFREANEPVSKRHVQRQTERYLSPAQFVIFTHRIRLFCRPQARSPSLLYRHEDHAAGEIQPLREMPFSGPSLPFLASQGDFLDFLRPRNTLWGCIRKCLKTKGALRGRTLPPSAGYAYTSRWISSGRVSDTWRMMLPRSMFTRALRCGAPRMRREAPTVAAMSTMVSAGDSLIA